MTDATLRELERRFRASGSVEDSAAAWLRARVQAGELDQGKVELAGRLGYRAARAATAKAPPEFDNLAVLTGGSAASSCGYAPPWPPCAPLI